MYLYHCSKCGKEVVPEIFKRLATKTFGTDIYRNNSRFCRCDTPDIEKSKREYKRSMRMIAETIRQINAEP